MVSAEACQLSDDKYLQATCFWAMRSICRKYLFLAEELWCLVCAALVSYTAPVLRTSSTVIDGTDSLT